MCDSGVDSAESSSLVTTHARLGTAVASATVVFEAKGGRALVFGQSAAGQCAHCCESSTPWAFCAEKALEFPGSVAETHTSCVDSKNGFVHFIGGGERDSFFVSFDLRRAHWLVHWVAADSKAKAAVKRLDFGSGARACVVHSGASWHLHVTGGSLRPTEHWLFVPKEVSSEAPQRIAGGHWRRQRQLPEPMSRHCLCWHRPSDALWLFGGEHSSDRVYCMKPSADSWLPTDRLTLPFADGLHSFAHNSELFEERYLFVAGGMSRVGATSAALRVLDLAALCWLPSATRLPQAVAHCAVCVVPTSAPPQSSHRLHVLGAGKRMDGHWSIDVRSLLRSSAPSPTLSMTSLGSGSQTPLSPATVKSKKTKKRPSTCRSSAKCRGSRKGRRQLLGTATPKCRKKKSSKHSATAKRAQTPNSSRKRRKYHASEDSKSSGRKARKRRRRKESSADSPVRRLREVFEQRCPKKKKKKKKKKGVRKAAAQSKVSEPPKVSLSDSPLTPGSGCQLTPAPAMDVFDDGHLYEAESHGFEIPEVELLSDSDSLEEEELSAVPLFSARRSAERLEMDTLLKRVAQLQAENMRLMTAAAVVDDETGHRAAMAVLSPIGEDIVRAPPSQKRSAKQKTTTIVEVTTEKQTLASASAAAIGHSKKRRSPLRRSLGPLPATSPPPLPKLKKSKSMSVDVCSEECCKRKKLKKRSSLQQVSVVTASGKRKKVKRSDAKEESAAALTFLGEGFDDDEKSAVSDGYAMMDRLASASPLAGTASSERSVTAQRTFGCFLAEICQMPDLLPAFECIEHANMRYLKEMASEQFLLHSVGVTDSERRQTLLNHMHDLLSDSKLFVEFATHCSEPPVCDCLYILEDKGLVTWKLLSQMVCSKHQLSTRVLRGFANYDRDQIVGYLWKAIKNFRKYGVVPQLDDDLTPAKPPPKRKRMSIC